ncbi:hypothetical protein DEO48_08480 [Enterobacter sp. CGMCC 5087]|uniref:hypothetical protein n=1 Tax=Enterobacter sp. CGMCC 5087 TaxID=2183878 RepID=UPI000D673A88|nr:hypothetical protein [Enterobacter sp. CGMCC 5087]PWI80520.1 hypothetical protein DEO48_08480 [Enterobacter sp. CGMCC 5087]
MPKNEYNQYLVKETNDILKSALAGGEARVLFGSIANQINKTTGRGLDSGTVSFDEIYEVIFEIMHKALNVKFSDAEHSESPDSK